MKALIWYWEHFNLGVEECDDLEEAARSEAAIDGERATIGVEVIDGESRIWHPYGEDNDFTRGVRQIQDERYERWRRQETEQPVRRLVEVKAPPEAAVESRDTAVVEWIRDDDEGEAIDRWSQIVGADRVSSRSPR